MEEDNQPGPAQDQDLLDKGGIGKSKSKSRAQVSKTKKLARKVVVEEEDEAPEEINTKSAQNNAECLVAEMKKSADIAAARAKERKKQWMGHKLPQPASEPTGKTTNSTKKKKSTKEQPKIDQEPVLSKEDEKDVSTSAKRLPETALRAFASIVKKMKESGKDASTEKGEPPVVNSTAMEQAVLEEPSDHDVEVIVPASTKRRKLSNGKVEVVVMPQASPAEAVASAVDPSVSQFLKKHLYRKQIRREPAHLAISTKPGPAVKFSVQQRK